MTTWAEDAAYADLYLLFDDGTVRVDLAGREVDANGCTVAVLADGTQFGKREPLTATLTSMLRDGDLITEIGSGNRKPTVVLEILGPNLGAVAATEERLQLALRDAGLLVWQPPDPSAEPCVFECLWFDLAFRQEGDWDMGEMRKRRVFVLTIDALPYARSLHEQTKVLSAAASVVIDDGSSLTGWSVWSGSGTLSTDGSAITFAGAARGDRLVLSKSVTLAAGDYVTMAVTGGYFDVISLAQGGAFGPTLPFSHKQGNALYYGPIPTSYVASSMWPLVGKMFGPALVIDSVEKAANGSMGRHSVLEFDPGGSAPTYGSLHLSSASALGDVMIQSDRSVDGRTPPLSPWISSTYTSATSTPEASSPSGVAWNIDNKVLSAIVPASLYPEEDATANLWAMVRTITPGGRSTLHWSTAGFMPDVGKVAGEVGGTTSHTFRDDAVGVWELVWVATIPTPPTVVGSAGSVEVAIRNDPTSVSVELGGWYLCPVGPDCATTVLSAGDATDVWIDPPSAAAPSGAVWVGTDGDRATAYQAGALLQADDPHTFSPGGTRISVLSEVAGAALTASWFVRNQHHISVAVPPST